MAVQEPKHTRELVFHMEEKYPVDNSRGAANNCIIDALRGAGDDGLHIDDIVELSGLTARKDVHPRLHDLLHRGLVQQVLPGQKWKISLSAPVTMNNTTEGTTDSSTEVTAQNKAVHTGKLPTINLPNVGKFASYKNSLQEYCQKLHLAVPVYQSTRGSLGLIGNVKFSSVSVNAVKASDTLKDADQRAAFEALKLLGYLEKSATYEHCNALKRKDVHMEGTPPSKHLCAGGATNLPNNGTYKSRLNELAQKNKLIAPVYNTVATPNGFFSTVTFNGRHFKSLSTCLKKKDAEAKAAHVALHVIAGVPLDNADASLTPAVEQPLNQADVSDMITEARQQATGGVASPKNRLQEYCHRLKKNLPLYETNLTSNGLYATVVTVEDKTYPGEPQQSKKSAERAAAEVALKDLGLMA